MMDLLNQEAARHGDKIRILPVERLEDLKEDIASFGILVGKQKLTKSEMRKIGIN